ncbi:MAG: UPF0280 family protein [Acidobacteriota bacterium]|nr:UPF0280 family protein [Acidobacteriota bacterium]
MSNRFYRDWPSGRLQSFTVSYRETDLWIGVDRFRPEMEEAVFDAVVKIHAELNECIKKNPAFLTSLEPLELSWQPEIIDQMLKATRLAPVGPMAAVAGAVADKIGKLLMENFDAREFIVENGGDIFVRNDKPMVVSVYAGASKLSGKVGLEIPPGQWGICTSSGTVGHSLSFGRADAVTVVSPTATVADAFATAYGNMVKGAEDIEKVLNLALNKEVETVLIIVGDKLGVVGKHSLKFFEPEKVHESKDF